MKITHETLNHVFSYHAPKGDQEKRYDLINDGAKVFSAIILGAVPDSEERTLALRDIQRARMMANAAIAINENH